MCLSPVYLYKYKDIDGKTRWTSNSKVAGQYTIPILHALPCGKCFECLDSQSSEWSYRICDEASLYDHNCFVTLTYDSDHLPSNGSLVKKDLQDFIKRLRFHLGDVKIRYFACGEYGSQHNRPHYHLVIFNYDFPDKYFYRKSGKSELLYRSDLLERLWLFGFSSIGDVSLHSAKYCAKYLQKLCGELPPDLLPPFTVMSRRPGIGFAKIKPASLDSDKLYNSGNYIHLPRYYLKVLSRDTSNEEAIEYLKSVRRNKAVLMSRDDIENYKREIFLKKRLYSLKVRGNI